MALTPRLPLLPPGARQISDSLAIHEDGERVVFFNAAGPIFSCRADDRSALRVGAVTVVRQGLATRTAVAKALSMHRVTLFRDERKFEESGVEGLVAKKRGPKGPHALVGAVRRRAQAMLGRGESIRATAASVGMSDRGLRHAIRRGLLTAASSSRVAAPAPVPSGQVPLQSASPAVGDASWEAVAPSAPVAAILPTQSADVLPGPAARAAEDQSCEAGVAVKRTAERALAAVGKLVEAAPEFERAQAVPGAGVLLALPELLAQGLLDVGQEVYGGLRNGFFGLRSVLLTFSFMALLRIRTPEQLTGHAPGELGRLLGLDRAPEVKTLRRKLAEMGERKSAQTFAQHLTERWATEEPSEIGLLYVDGHVRPYHGRTHSLPKLHVQQRGRPMPATKDFHVNDRRAEPLFFVTATATEGLLETLDAALLPEIRRLVGTERRVIVAFDREGWSPDLFSQWKEEKFDVLTYRKGKQAHWHERSFDVVRGKVGGQKVEYRLAERKVTLSNGLRVREVRRLTEDGHQTAVVTTSESLPTLSIAHRMFSRWSQENFFRYMRHEFALDHLCTHEVEPADPARLVTSPARAALEKKLKAARAARTRLVEHRLALEPQTKVRVGNRVVGGDEIDQLILDRDDEIEKIAAAVARLPKKVRIDTLLAPEEIVKLERERKILVDVLKLTAYRAESALARLLDPLLARHDDEARKFLKSVFQATADLLPDPRRRLLTVRFHGLASPRATRALAALCAVVNERETTYPGTSLRLRFEAPTLQE